MARYKVTLTYEREFDETPEEVVNYEYANNAYLLHIDPPATDLKVTAEKIEETIVLTPKPVVSDRTMPGEKDESSNIKS